MHKNYIDVISQQSLCSSMQCSQDSASRVKPAKEKSLSILLEISGHAAVPHHCFQIKFHLQVILLEFQTSGNCLMPDLGCIVDVSELANASRLFSVWSEGGHYPAERLHLV